MESFSLRSVYLALALVTCSHLPLLADAPATLLQPNRALNPGQPKVVYVPVTLVPMLKVNPQDGGQDKVDADYRALQPIFLRIKTYPGESKKYFFKKFRIEADWNMPVIVQSASQLSLKLAQCIDRECESVEELGGFSVSGLIEKSSADHRGDYRFSADDARIFNAVSSSSRVAFSVGDGLRHSKNPLKNQILSLIKGPAGAL